MSYLPDTYDRALIRVCERDFFLTLDSDQQKTLTLQRLATLVTWGVFTLTWAQTFHTAHEAMVVTSDFHVGRQLPERKVGSR